MTSRTENSLKNLKSGFLYNIISIVTPFIIRTIMLKTLGTEYLGLSSLFTSILQVLNMAELGVSSAIVFSMYEPISKNDTKKICALLMLYRKIYAIIGIIVLTGGMLLIPLLPYMIHGSYPNDINIYVLYFIYLFNTVLSYFLFAYKSSLLNAVQHQYTINNINLLLVFLRFIYQACVLIIFKNYYLFLIGNILYTILYNIWVSIVVKKEYPEYVCEGKIDDDTRDKIRTQVKGLIIGKLSYTSRNSFDSIVLSSFCGLSLVAVYSNYYYIFSAVLGIILVVGQSITASVGNRLATCSIEQNYSDFKKFNYYYSWIGCWFSICLLCMYQPFMNIWVGKELTSSTLVMILFVLYFYITQLGQCRSVYAAAAGIWWETRFVQIGEMIGNLLLNFILGYYFGMEGVLIATIVTILLFGIIGQGLVVFRSLFKRSSKEYFLSIIEETILFVSVGCVCFFLSSAVDKDPAFNFLWSTIISILIPNTLFVLWSIVNKDRKKYLLYLFSGILNRKPNKN